MGTEYSAQETSSGPRTGAQDADPKLFNAAMADGCIMDETNPVDRVGPRPWDDSTRDQGIVIWNADLMIHEYIDDRAAHFCINYTEGIRGYGKAEVPSDSPFNRDYEDVEA